MAVRVTSGPGPGGGVSDHGGLTGNDDPADHEMHRHRSGTLAARPAFGVPERLYLATDIGVCFLDTGTAWIPLSFGAYESVTLYAAMLAWTNMPAAETQFRSNTDERDAVQKDLTYASQARFMVPVIVAGATGSKLYLKYSTDNGATHNVLAATAAQGEIPLDGALAFKKTNWFDLAAGAKADVLVMLFGSGGDAALDPNFGIITVEFR
jgi:hypothetical protein